jgi:hypothetical protein
MSHETAESSTLEISTCLDDRYGVESEHRDAWITGKFLLAQPAQPDHRFVIVVPPMGYREHVSQFPRVGVMCVKCER